MAAEEDFGGDPELEAAAAAERKANQASQEEEAVDSDEEEWNPKDAKEVAKKERQMARGGINFTSKLGPAGKVRGPKGTPTPPPMRATSGGICRAL